MAQEKAAEKQPNGVNKSGAGTSSDVVEILDSDDEMPDIKSRKEPTPLFRADSPAPASSSASGDEDMKPAVESPSKKNKVEEIFLRRNNFRSSTKLDALVRHLNAVREEEENFHVVVFSQFTSFCASSHHLSRWHRDDRRTVDICEKLMERERFQSILPLCLYTHYRANGRAATSDSMARSVKSNVKRSSRSSTSAISPASSSSRLRLAVSV